MHSGNLGYSLSILCKTKLLTVKVLEAKLISMVRKGKPDAQALLYEKYRTYWFSICLRYNKNRDDSLDALQNALIIILSKVHQFDPEKGSFKSWSSKIVINENLKLLRKKNLQLELIDSRSEEIDSYNYEISEPAYTKKELIQMIQTLPDGYRAVFNLYVMEGYNHQEISEILNISIGTSKSQLSKAKKMLRTKLGLHTKAIRL